MKLRLGDLVKMGRGERGTWRQGGNGDWGLGEGEAWRQPDLDISTALDVT